MATPPPPPPSQGGSPHLRRDLAESFGADAERYDRARPSYPAGLTDAVVAGIPGRSVLDVGIGTGISARPFRDAGYAVLGVEVDPKMAAVARRRGFEVEVAKFEDWDAAGRRFDAVIAGQTWHWIDPVAGAVKAAQVLRPEGRLAVFWNVGDPAPEIAAGFAEVYRRVDTGLPFTPWAVPALEGSARISAATADGIRRSGAFTEPEQWRFDWETLVTREAWLDQVPTAGGHSRLPAAKLDALLDGMAEVIDAAGGSFTMRYATVATAAVKVGAPTGR
jgi:SAM-dependent methyltransferase